MTSTGANWQRAERRPRKRLEAESKTAPKSFEGTATGSVDLETEAVLGATSFFIVEVAIELKGATTSRSAIGPLTASVSGLAVTVATVLSTVVATVEVHGRRHLLGDETL